MWPLKYLRKYGCDRDIFSFEAGRKCPGGEGLYAFSTKKASQLFDIVARNISEGGLEREDVGVLSPQDESQGASPPVMTPLSAGPSPHPPPPPTSNPPSHLPPNATPRLPEYTNVNYQDGQHVVVLAATTNGHATPPPLPIPPLQTDQETPSPPPKLNYTEVTLPEASKSTLEFEEKEVEKRVSYSEIDIKQTEEHKQKKALEQAKNQRPLPNLGTGEFKIVTPTERDPNSRKSSRPPSASSSSGSAAPPPSSAAQRSMSEGNFSFNSQHKESNGFIPGRAHSQSTSAVQDSTSGGPTLLYQNITMSKCNAAPPTIPEDSEVVSSEPHVQANYVNIHPNPALGGGRRGTAPVISHRKNSDECLSPLARHESDAQATYQNLRIGMGGAASPPRTSNSLLSTPPPRVSGPKMGIYAQLDLSGPTTSTPKGKGDAPERRKSSEDEENHMTLNFSGVALASNNNTPQPMESSRSTTRHSPPPAQLQLAENRSATENSSLQPAAALIQDRPGDNTTVNYSTMDFNAIRGLRLTKEQREQEIKERLAEEALEEERRKREEAANPGKKKKGKKGKKKDRRNSHQ